MTMQTGIGKTERADISHEDLKTFTMISFMHCPDVKSVWRQHQIFFGCRLSS